MKVAIPPSGLTISIDRDGKAASNLILHVLYDVCPTWCELALRHLEDAKAARNERIVAWEGTDQDHKAKCLECEFGASMQAIMAAAISLDAFYSRIQTYVQLPSLLIQQWRDKRTARYMQITEVLRRAFSLKTEETGILRQNLKQIYRFRDLAVHPSGKIQAPLQHPEMDVRVEWRFATFCAQNADLLVSAATGILWELAKKGQPANNNITEYMQALRQRLTILFPSD
ncbi:MAG: hypothetical protein ABI167_13295 [Nitrosospira sp.]